MFTVKRSRVYLVFFKFIQLFFIISLKLLYRVEVLNREKFSSVPKNGLVLCCNHVSALDPIVMGAFFPRPVYFMAKIELFRNRFVRGILGFVNSFPVNRNGVGRNSVAKAIEILKSGNVFGIFPEGHRSDNGEIGDTRRGVGLIAYLGNASVMPMAIYNSRKDPREKNNKNKELLLKVKIIFGDVINTEEICLKYPKKEAISIISGLAMDSIKKLYEKF